MQKFKSRFCNLENTVILFCHVIFVKKGYHETTANKEEVECTWKRLSIHGRGRLSVHGQFYVKKCVVKADQTGISVVE